MLIKIDRRGKEYILEIPDNYSKGQIKELKKQFMKGIVEFDNSEPIKVAFY